MDKILEYFRENDLFGRHCGVEIEEIGEGQARVSMKIEKHHLNGVGTVHGGALFTLADIAFAVAGNSHGKIAVAINVNISFMKAVVSGKLVAHAKEVCKNPKLGCYRVEIKDEQGDIVAVFEGMTYIKKGEFEGLKSV